MRKPLFVAASSSCSSGAALTVSFASGTRAVTRPMRLQGVRAPVTDTVINTGKRATSRAISLTLHNGIFDATNSHQVGHDQGDCIRISPNAGTWECRWLTYIAGRGAIMVEGAFFDKRDSTMAVTGGTLEFRNARGSMKLVAEGRTRYDFVFQLLP